MTHCRWSLRNSICLLALSSVAAAGCLSASDAEKHIGATGCVTAQVAKITQGPAGVQYIDFCSDHRQCPFSGVVFARDLRDVGDIRTLPGKTVEIHGQIREYDGHAEIIVSNARQLRGPGINLPPVPKAYDVEQRGHYSAGTFRPAKKPKKNKRKRPAPPNTLEIPPDQPE